MVYLVDSYNELLSLCFNTDRGRDKIVDILHTTRWNALSPTKVLECRLKFSLRFVPNGAIGKKSPCVRVIAKRRISNKPLTETILVQCNYANMGSRQWVKIFVRARFNCVQNVYYHTYMVITEKSNWATLPVIVCACYEEVVFYVEYRSPCRLKEFCVYIDGLIHDCSISIANAIEILQPCTKISLCIPSYLVLILFKVSLEIQYYGLVSAWRIISSRHLKFLHLNYLREWQIINR